MNLRALGFFTTVMVVAGGLHLYLWRRLVRDVTQSVWLRRATAGVFVFLLVGGATIRMWAGRVPAGPFRLLGTFFMAWMGTALYLVFAFVLWDLFRWGKRKLVGPSPVLPERRRLLTGAVASAAASVTGYGLYRANFAPEVHQVPVRLTKLPKVLDGFSVVQLTDIHVGAVIQTKFMEELVERVNALKPDLVAITGDLVDGSVEELGRHVGVLGRLQSRHGSFFVTGNHDYYSGADEWAATLQGMGMQVLRNRSVRIGDAGGSFVLAGVDDWGTRWGRHGYDLDRALEGVRPEDASVLLAHQPSNFDEVARRGVGLQLSGHTHGGQMFPATGIASLIWGERNRGLSRTLDAQIYVSRGCGFVGPPLRVGSPPEIVKLVLSSS